MLLVVVRQRAEEFLVEADERVPVFLIGEGRIGHAGELLVEDVLVVLQRRIEKFVERTVVSEGQGEEPRLDLFGYRTGLVELRNVEEIARMLPVQRRTELPAVKFRAGKDIDLGRAKEFLRSRTCRQLSHVEDRSSQDVIKAIPLVAKEDIFALKCCLSSSLLR